MHVYVQYVCRYTFEYMCIYIFYTWIISNGFLAETPAKTPLPMTDGLNIGLVSVAVGELQILMNTPLLLVEPHYFGCKKKR